MYLDTWILEDIHYQLTEETKAIQLRAFLILKEYHYFRKKS